MSDDVEKVKESGKLAHLIPEEEEQFHVYVKLLSKGTETMRCTCLQGQHWLVPKGGKGC